jgi:hypothetical protein
MKCISVYTGDFEKFSDMLDKVLTISLNEDEEIEIDGVAVVDAGDVPENYISKMTAKTDVVVMKDKERELTILQRGELFEILMPKASPGK